jgi:GDPmannose 4,6-dehydratase
MHLDRADSGPATAVVTGAAGQDGFYLARRLVQEGMIVHAIVRDASSADELRGLGREGRIEVHAIDLDDRDGYASLIARVRPEEFYNFAGQSSVSASFLDPTSTWRTNADSVQGMLEAIRLHSPATRFYQSSSTDMFGAEPGVSVVHDEMSPLMPQSPYAAAKAAAHVACDAYRRAFGLRIAAGILANHESRRRTPRFLTRKVVDHVGAIRGASDRELRGIPPLRVGNLIAQRDWGFAPDYVDGIVLILRQVAVRARVSGQPAEDDVGASYRDYVLGSGQLSAVWELVDRTFALAGLPLAWNRSGEMTSWTASFRASGDVAVVVDPELIRPTDPGAIRADASRARRELGWAPRPGLDRFLEDMLGVGTEAAAAR